MGSSRGLSFQIWAIFLPFFILWATESRQTGTPITLNGQIVPCATYFSLTVDCPGCAQLVYKTTAAKEGNGFFSIQMEKGDQDQNADQKEGERDQEEEGKIGPITVSIQSMSLLGSQKRSNSWTIEELDPTSMYKLYIGHYDPHRVFRLSLRGKLVGPELPWLMPGNLYSLALRQPDTGNVLAQAWVQADTQDRYDWTKPDVGFALRLNEQGIGYVRSYARPSMVLQLLSVEVDDMCPACIDVLNKKGKFPEKSPFCQHIGSQRYAGVPRKIPQRGRSEPPTRQNQNREMTMLFVENQDQNIEMRASNVLDENIQHRPVMENTRHNDFRMDPSVTRATTSTIQVQSTMDDLVHSVLKYNNNDANISGHRSASQIMPIIEYSKKINHDGIRRSNTSHDSSSRGNMSHDGIRRGNTTGRTKSIAHDMNYPSWDDSEWEDVNFSSKRRRSNLKPFELKWNCLGVTRLSTSRRRALSAGYAALAAYARIEVPIYSDDEGPRNFWTDFGPNCDRAENANRSGNTNRSERTGNGNRSENATGNANRSGNTNRSERANRTENANRSENANPPEKDNRSENMNRSENANRSEGTNQSSNPDQSKHANRSENVNRSKNANHRTKTRVSQPNRAKRSVQSDHSPNRPDYTKIRTKRAIKGRKFMEIIHQFQHQTPKEELPEGLEVLMSVHIDMPVFHSDPKDPMFVYEFGLPESEKEVEDVNQQSMRMADGRIVSQLAKSERSELLKTAQKTLSQNQVSSSSQQNGVNFADNGGQTPSKFLNQLQAAVRERKRRNEIAAGKRPILEEIREETLPNSEVPEAENLRGSELTIVPINRFTEKTVKINDKPIIIDDQKLIKSEMDEKNLENLKKSKKKKSKNIKETLDQVWNSIKKGKSKESKTARKGKHSADKGTDSEHDQKLKATIASRSGKDNGDQDREKQIDRNDHRQQKKMDQRNDPKADRNLSLEHGNSAIRIDDQDKRYQEKGDSISRQWKNESGNNLVRDKNYQNMEMEREQNRKKVTKIESDKNGKGKGNQTREIDQIDQDGNGKQSPSDHDSWDDPSPPKIQSITNHFDRFLLNDVERQELIRGMEGDWWNIGLSMEERNRLSAYLKGQEGVLEDLNPDRMAKIRLIALILRALITGEGDHLLAKFDHFEKSALVQLWDMVNPETGNTDQSDHLKENVPLQAKIDEEHSERSPDQRSKDAKEGQNSPDRKSETGRQNATDQQEPIPKFPDQRLDNDKAEIHLPDQGSKMSYQGQTSPDRRSNGSVNDKGKLSPDQRSDESPKYLLQAMKSYGKGKPRRKFSLNDEERNQLINEIKDHNLDLSLSKEEWKNLICYLGGKGNLEEFSPKLLQIAMMIRALISGEYTLLTDLDEKKWVELKQLWEKISKEIGNNWQIEGTVWHDQNQDYRKENAIDKTKSVGDQKVSPAVEKSKASAPGKKKVKKDQKYTEKDRKTAEISQDTSNLSKAHYKDQKSADTDQNHSDIPEYPSDKKKYSVLQLPTSPDLSPIKFDKFATKKVAMEKHPTLEKLNRAEADESPALKPSEVKAKKDKKVGQKDKINRKNATKVSDIYRNENDQKSTDHQDSRSHWLDLDLNHDELDRLSKYMDGDYEPALMDLGSEKQTRIAHIALFLGALIESDQKLLDEQGIDGRERQKLQILWDRLTEKKVRERNPEQKSDGINIDRYQGHTDQNQENNETKSGLMIVNPDEEEEEEVQPLVRKGRNQRKLDEHGHLLKGSNGDVSEKKADKMDQLTMEFDQNSDLGQFINPNVKEFKEEKEIEQFGPKSPKSGSADDPDWYAKKYRGVLSSDWLGGWLKGDPLPDQQNVDQANFTKNTENGQENAQNSDKKDLEQEINIKDKKENQQNENKNDQNLEKVTKSRKKSKIPPIRSESELIKTRKQWDKSGEFKLQLEVKTDVSDANQSERKSRKKWETDAEIKNRSLRIFGQDKLGETNQDLSDNIQSDQEISDQIRNGQEKTEQIQNDQRGIDQNVNHQETLDQIQMDQKIADELQNDQEMLHEIQTDHDISNIDPNRQENANFEQIGQEMTNQSQNVKEMSDQNQDGQIISDRRQNDQNASDDVEKEAFCSVVRRTEARILQGDLEALRSDAESKAELKARVRQFCQELPRYIEMGQLDQILEIFTTEELDLLLEMGQMEEGQEEEEGEEEQRQTSEDHLISHGRPYRNELQSESEPADIDADSESEDRSRFTRFYRYRSPEPARRPNRSRGRSRERKQIQYKKEHRVESGEEIASSQQSSESIKKEKKNKQNKNSSESTKRKKKTDKTKRQSKLALNNSPTESQSSSNRPKNLESRRQNSSAKCERKSKGQSAKNLNSSIKPPSSSSASDISNLPDLEQCTTEEEENDEFFTPLESDPEKAQNPDPIPQNPQTGEKEEFGPMASPQGETHANVENHPSFWKRQLNRVKSLNDWFKPSEDDFPSSPGYLVELAELFKHPYYPPGHLVEPDDPYNDQFPNDNV